MTAAGRTRQTVHIRNNSRLVKPHGTRRDWLQPHRLRPMRSHRPPMKIKMGSGTTMAAAEGPSVPVALRLSHSDVNRLADWHAVRRNLGGDYCREYDWQSRRNWIRCRCVEACF